MTFRFLAAAALMVAATPVLANDSTAQLGAGGLQLVRNEEVALLAEDLYVSATEVRVAYRFLNQTDEPVTYLVAFPLPVIDAVVPEAVNVMLPNESADDFIDFSVSVDGKRITPELEARVTALGVDRTELLRSHGLPLVPIGARVYRVLDKAPQSETEELNRLGLVIVDPYNVQAAWKLEMTYYWEQTFPPGKEVVVQHRYKPVTGFGFFGDWIFSDPGYRDRYCIDGAFEAAARKKLDAIADRDNPYMNEKRVSYVLTTANNWATPIRDFRLVVDKGTPDSLVSFCGTNVKKIAPTQFEMRATNFMPERELEILIASPTD